MNLEAQVKLKGSVEKGDKCFNSPKRSKVKKEVLLLIVMGRFFSQNL